MNRSEHDPCPAAHGNTPDARNTPQSQAGPGTFPTTAAPEASPAREPSAPGDDAGTRPRRPQADDARPQRPRPGEYYFDAGQLVFTAQYHLRRGYCCGNGCRHCPYQEPLPADSP